MNNINSSYSAIHISSDEAAGILLNLYQLEGEISPLPGELDLNFRINSNKGKFVLKIMRPDADLNSIQFRESILKHLKKKDPDFLHPVSFTDIDGKNISQITDSSGTTRYVRLLSWIDGKVWSSVNPKKDDLLFSLGERAGAITSALNDFNHKYAKRQIDWDIAQGEWTYDFLNLFDKEQSRTISYFQEKFRSIQKKYSNLRKSVVHNDGNDNNIIVSNDLLKPEVVAIIDYGDSVFTQTINDLAISISYAVMGKPDPLGSSLQVVRGYHNRFPILEEELELLYILIAMRLVISVTKSAINRHREPENKYLLVSEKPAWELLNRWINIDQKLAHYNFRFACGYTPHPDEEKYSEWAEGCNICLKDVFPDLEFDKVFPIDMSIGSTWLGHEAEHLNNEYLALRIDRLREIHNDSVVAGGYLETRPFYCTEAYEREGNCGREYRSVHLGLDIWTEPETPIHAIMGGTVYSIFNNNKDKDYGPTLILEHKTSNGITFFTLYGHMTLNSLDLNKKGDQINEGDIVGYVGDTHENGSWAPHLHFQIILDMLGFENDFPGVAFDNEVGIWKSICPDPNFIFRESGLVRVEEDNSRILKFRTDHLGKGLSLSYNEPLKILRGSGVYLLDNKGRKYLDTVNNVAHVGHENYRVVKAGQDQMAILNTNTRYLHNNINRFAEELLKTFPDKLSVAHFVNSGSEANELAMRMAYTATGEKDIIAVEVGYHGNTNGCINISSYKFDGKGGKGAPEHTHIVPLPDKFRGIYRGEKTGEKYASHLDQQIEVIRSKGRNTAAFICESIISCGGQIELPEDYLKIAYKSVRDAGGVCIADEVQVGCGRVGEKFWGFQLHGVIPDIVTIGKPIGNGHPVAAVVCTKEIADAFANGMEYFNTFGGNPVSCAIGLEVLRTIKEEKLQENALETGKYLKKGLISLQKKFPIIGDVRGQGLFLGFELTDGDLNPLTDKTSYLSNRMRELGILTSIDGKDNNVIKIKPPIIFSRQNADYFISKLAEVFKEDYMTL